MQLFIPVITRYDQRFCRMLVPGFIICDGLLVQTDCVPGHPRLRCPWGSRRQTPLGCRTAFMWIGGTEWGWSPTLTHGSANPVERLIHIHRTINIDQPIPGDVDYWERGDNIGRSMTFARSMVNVESKAIFQSMSRVPTISIGWS